MSSFIIYFYTLPRFLSRVVAPVFNFLEVYSIFLLGWGLLSLEIFFTMKCLATVLASVASLNLCNGSHSPFAPSKLMLMISQHILLSFQEMLLLKYWQPRLSLRQ